ncbi:cytochrome c biogenesis CcdA family protein [Indioceanicola profundi]|uniref:cytochrome c biogenesis CcdA family protein n=1 Tax=Indioceanicola profundi TaxID=2220096 RepID=UPI000E6AC879|nr:cytochrome c biogenesis protein CcdA [Indioceanicola profundi]
MTGLDVSYLGALGAGILSFLSPCVLPLVPPYLAFMAGVSLDQMTTKVNADGTVSAVDGSVRARVTASAIMFILGFATVFVALGATASAASALIAENLTLLSQISGVLIILLGLHFLGVFRIMLLYREARFQAAKPAGLAGAYVVGLAFAFGWTPCVGPVLAAILMVAASEQSVAYGASLLGTYALGIGLPFLFAALAVEQFMGFMRRFRRHLGRVEKIMGGLLVLTGVLFLTGTIPELSYWLLEMFPVLGQIG